MSPISKSRLNATGLILAASLALTACDSAEERAEEYYQNAVALAEAGDTDRAVIELRNALQLDESHIGARMLFANIALDQGQVARGYRQLLAVAEINPDDMETRRRLAELAITNQNWEEAERHGAVLLAAETEGNEVVDLALQFRQAAVDRDDAKIRELLREAEELYKVNPENEILQRLLVEGYMQNQNFDASLDVVDTVIEQRPDDRQFWDMKLAILGQRQDFEAAEAHLRAMIEQFPGDTEVQSNIIRLYVAAGRSDEAEAFMRELIDDTEAGLAAQISLIAFIRQSRGSEAALAEVNSALESRETPDPTLEALRASLLFDLGERDQAIAEMEELIASDVVAEQRNGWKIALARMLQANGNEVGARTRVEEVLAEDPTMVEAVKMQAAWQIEQDQVDEAIAALRAALDQEPEDADLMALLSRAHARAGDTELAEEMLSLSVEASNYALSQSLTYGRQLLLQENYRAAENLLINSLRRNGNNVALFQLLAQVYLAEEDFARAEQVEGTLRRMDTEEATREADDLKLRILGRREGIGAAAAYLENLISETEDDTAARVALIRARLAAGDSEEALRVARDFAEENPGPDGTLVVAAAELASGNLEAAETGFASVVEAAPDNIRAWTQLLRVQNAQGKRDEAEATLETALAQNPDAPDLLWAKASIAEAQNDIDGAIGIYERLYEQLPNSVVVANNLGSLLATYREDEESLERAFTVTRRLRGTEVAPFQDTYGWILYRRGEVEEALGYLEDAAEGLPNDPIVQYHLARALQDLGRTEEARKAYARAVEIAPEDDPRDQIAEARTFLQSNPVGE